MSESQEEDGFSAFARELVCAVWILSLGHDRTSTEGTGCSISVFLHEQSWATAQVKKVNRGREHAKTVAFTLLL